MADESLYRAITDLRGDLSRRIERLDSELSTQITRIESVWKSEFATHRNEHSIEQAARNAKIRWAVTTITTILIALGSNGVTLYLALSGTIGGN